MKVSSAWKPLHEGDHEHLPLNLEIAWKPVMVSAEANVEIPLSGGVRLIVNEQVPGDNGD